MDSHFEEKKENIKKKGNSDDFRLSHIHQYGGGDMLVKKYIQFFSF